MVEEDEELDEAFCVNNEFDDDDDDGDQEEVSSSDDGSEEGEDGDYDDVSSILDETDDHKTMLRNLEGRGDLHDGDMMVPNGVELVGFKLDTGRSTGGITISRHLFEANGKLLMVKREHYQPVHSRGYNRKLEVLEADIGTRMWITVIGGVSGALFVSGSCSKYVPSFKEEGDGLTCHFVDEHHVVVNQKSQPYSPCETEPTWLFPQKLVV
jgi:hypothetical protein